MHAVFGFEVLDAILRCRGGTSQCRSSSCQKSDFRVRPRREMKQDVESGDRRGCYWLLMLLYAVADVAEPTEELMPSNSQQHLKSFFDT